MFRRPLIWAFGVLALGLAVAFNLGIPLFRESRLDTLVGEGSIRAYAEGTVSQIRNTGYGEMITLVSCRVFPGTREGVSDGESLFCRGILVSVPGAGEAEAGDEVRVSGRLEKLPLPDNPGEFDSRLYYRTSGIDFRIRAEKPPEIEKKAGFSARALAWRIRSRLSDSIDSVAADENEAGLMRAVLLGDRSGLEDATYEVFRLGGIAHILSVSGLHLTLLGGAVMRFLRRLRLPYPVCAGGAEAVLLIYMAVLDAGPSAGRALIMFTVSLIAPLFRRTYDLLSAMALAGILMLVRQPLYIADGAFQLSFSAIAGIGLLYPQLSGLIREAGKGKKISPPLLKGLEAGALSFSVWISSLAFTAHNFYSVSLLGMLLNLLALPLMTVIMASAAAGAAAGLIWAAAGVFFAGAAHYAFSFLIDICTAVSGLRGTMIVTGDPGWAAVVLCAIVTALPSLLRLGRKDDRKAKIRYLLCLFAIPVIVFFRAPGGLSLTALYVGQGDSTVIMDGSGNTVIIDCGSSDKSDVAGSVILPFLKYSAADRVDVIFLSHADNDHVNGLGGILADPEISVGAVAIPAGTADDPCWDGVRAAAESTGTVLICLEKGDELYAGKMTFRVLSPAHGQFAGDQNENSMVLEMVCGDFSALFCGDIGAAAESELSEQADLWSTGGKSVDYLKCAHHGSRFSSTREFLDFASPAETVISAGRGNLYGHPAPETLERLGEAGSAVFCTAWRGAVTTCADSSGTVRVRCFRDVE